MLGSDKVASDDKKVWNNLKLKGDAKNFMTKQAQKKRKVVCLNEDDDVPKTPVHGGAAKNIKSPFALDIKNGNNAHSEKSDAAKMAHRNYSELEEGHLKEPCSQLHVDASSINPPEEDKADEATPVHIPLSQDKLDSKQFPSKVTRVSYASPVKSHRPVPTTTELNVEWNKSSIPLLKASSIATPKTLPRKVNIPSVDFKEPDALHVDRLEEGMEERSNVHTGSGTPKTSKTMKHLIAAAQAKWKKVHSQYLSSNIHNVHGGTPSPSTVHPYITSSALHRKMENTKSITTNSSKKF